MPSDTKMYTVDKFLGLNEGGDGDTELKMGEASRMENFLVTDAFNLTLRPGLQRVSFGENREPGEILAEWSGKVGEDELLVVCDFLGGVDRLFVLKVDADGQETKYAQSGALGLTTAEGAVVSIFTFGEELYVMSTGKTVVFTDGSFREVSPYVPLVIAGADPAGGGTTLENINLLTGLRRIDYSSDGESTAYLLPEEAVGISALIIDNVPYAVETAGSFDAETHTFTFLQAPVKGVGNVEFTYSTDPEKARRNRMQILSCRLHEEYNGSTDTRLFVAGNGSNLCFYSGVTRDGLATPAYFPAMNEVAVDLSASEITGLKRHYSRLLVFKPDGTHAISYEPVTLQDGSTVAGFYLRPMHREYGNEAMGQIQTVNNYPRSLCKGGVYEWRISASYYRDERYAERVSEAVRESMRSADLRRAVTCDDGVRKSYYIFLNDEKGTALVHRYDLGREGVWCMYRSELFLDVRFASVFGGEMLIFNGTEAFRMEEGLTMDASPVPGEESRQIKAVWESGFLNFGADFRRKYSSYIYLSVLPQFGSRITVTAQTDKRADYMEKQVEHNVFDWLNANFRDWTFNVNDSPGINRVRLKVKKFVYYKLVFRIDTPGASGTILGFDQQVRFSSMAK